MNTCNCCVGVAHIFWLFLERQSREVLQDTPASTGSFLGRTCESDVVYNLFSIHGRDALRATPCSAVTKWKVAILPARLPTLPSSAPKASRAQPRVYLWGLHLLPPARMQPYFRKISLVDGLVVVIDVCTVDPSMKCTVCFCRADCCKYLCGVHSPACGFLELAGKQ